MEAVLLATGPWAGFGILGRRLPPPLLPVANVPVLGQHLAACRCAGVAVVHLFATHEHRAFRDVLGEGRRWGLRLTLHRLSGAEVAAARLRGIASGRARRVIVLRDDVVLMPDAIRTLVQGALLDDITGLPIRGSEQWGALSLPAEACEAIEGPDLRSALQAVWSEAGSRVAAEHHAEDCQAFAKAEDLLRLNLEACEELPWLGMGQARREGVFVQSRVRIDPTARLVPPVLIGQNTHIGAGVVLGPRVAVGEDCFIGDRAVLHDCLLLGGTYIGTGCEVRDAVVDGCGIYHRRHGAELVLPRSTLLADIDRRRGGTRPGHSDPRSPE